MRRLLHPAVALVATFALLLASPLGSGAVAAAQIGSGGKESQLEKEVDALSPGQRAEFLQQLSGGLAASGIDLRDPQVEAELARTLGVPQGEIHRIVAEVGASPSGEGPLSQPILFLFVSAALIFAPAIFKTVGGTLYEWVREVEAVEGIGKFGG